MGLVVPYEMSFDFFFINGCNGNQSCDAIFIKKTAYYVITLSYIVFRMAHSEPSSEVKGKAIYYKNLSN